MTKAEAQKEFDAVLAHARAVDQFKGLLEDGRPILGSSLTDELLYWSIEHSSSSGQYAVGLQQIFKDSPVMVSSGSPEKTVTFVNNVFGVRRPRDRDLPDDD